jgi:hypothetical protein
MNENSNIDGVMEQMSSNNALLRTKIDKTTFGTASQTSQIITRKPLLKTVTTSALSKTNNITIEQPVISTVRPRIITGGNLIRTTEEKMGLENQNSSNNAASCPDGYIYSSKNKICYQCPDGYVYNETDNSCYPANQAASCPDGYVYNEAENNCYPKSGNGGGGSTQTTDETQGGTAEGGYATENATVEEPKVEEKVMKKVDKKYYWYAGLAIGLLAIAYLLKKSK